VRIGEQDFETLQLGAFATPGLLLAQGTVGLTRNPGSATGVLEDGFSNEVCLGYRSADRRMPLVRLNFAGFSDDFGHEPIVIHVHRA
jgi:hypothetical protein